MVSLPVFSTTDYVVGLSGVLLVLHLISKKLRGNKLPLPPGPKPLPILGNILDFPKHGVHEARFWTKHKALYGPISSLSLPGQTVVILNDFKIARELLDKRSAIYSNRPFFTYSGEMIGLGVQTPMLRYDDRLKLHRKHMHNYFGTPSAVAQHDGLQEVEARRFLLRILNDPESFMQHIRAFPGAIILKLSHGYSISPEDQDPLVEIAEEVFTKIISESLVAGKWLVDSIPLLKHVPEWMPGAKFKRQAIGWAKTTQDFYKKPYAFVKHEMAAGKAVPSLASTLIEQGVHKKHGDAIVMNISATIFGAGADTTVIALATFYLAMVLNPDVFKRIQTEIDSVVGHDRLPSFEDRPNLPYIEAVIKETVRWQTVIPIILPHVSTQEDVYMGYHIPKGAVLLSNAWQMAHDPENYHDPFTFKPERFLGEDGREPELDPRLFVFGFGRRLCPGREFAQSTLFIAIAMTAAAFDITKAKDEFGQDIEPVNEFSAGLVSHPTPFKCIIKPRTDKASELIRSVVEEHPFVTGDSEILRSL